MRQNQVYIMKRTILIGLLIIIAFIVFIAITSWNFSKITLEPLGIAGETGPREIAGGIKDCDDKDECTEDSFDYEKQICVNEEIISCCGNEICETRETYLTCPQDCPNPKDVLEENISEIKEYPKLEQAFVDLYSSDGFTDSEMKYIKALFDIFKSKTDLHQADEEVLVYLMTDTIEPRMPPNNNKFPDMDKEYFVEEIIPLANDITEGSSGEVAIRKIVSWVRENIDVTWTAIDIGEDKPKLILEKREVPNACDYWATLITVLCRASGIPAREMGGGFPLSPGGHAWTEAYVNGEWISVDSTGYLEEDPEKEKWLHSVYAYDPLNDRVMDVSLSYNTEILDLIIEHTKELVGETSATKQAEEIFIQYKEESDLANKYAYTQDIMGICISEIIAKQEGYESEDIKVLDLWDWDKLIKEEAFLSELEKAKVISIYDFTAEGVLWYKGSGTGEFPLEKINTLIPEVKENFQGEIYFFFTQYLTDCGLLSDAVVINLFDPEDVDALEMAYPGLLTGTSELLQNFIIEIVSVANKEKNYTTFHLPKEIQEGTEYSIGASAPFDMENTAFDINFEVQSMVTIQDIMMLSVVGQADVIGDFPDLSISERKKWIQWRHFDNIKVIDKEGEVYADPEIYRNPRPDPTVVVGPPYKIEDCPSDFFIIPGQTLEIYSENDIVIIKGDMTTEQILVS